MTDRQNPSAAPDSASATGAAPAQGAGTAGRPTPRARRRWRAPATIRGTGSQTCWPRTAVSYTCGRSSPRTPTRSSPSTANCPNAPAICGTSVRTRRSRRRTCSTSRSSTTSPAWRSSRCSATRSSPSVGTRDSRTRATVSPPRWPSPSPMPTRAAASVRSCSNTSPARPPRTDCTPSSPRCSPRTGT